MLVTPVRLITSLAVLLTLWALLYWDALLAMEDTWRRSETFAHGYFIIPISLWLTWRERSKLNDIEFTASWLALPLLACSLVVGLLAFAADIAVLHQVSAVAAFIAILWLVLGNQLIWQFKFALLFLFFAVPMGENLIPWLQDVTAWISVFLLKVHGIPTFRDGLYIQTSSGLFEVAVACSGIRYLIASLAVGTLYAHLTYNKISKQLAFIVFALVLPIIANGIRAYLIIIIAHYSEMKYATGVDHLIYGWLFFGFVIMLMFYIGGKFADSVELEQSTQRSAICLTGKIMPAALITSLLLLILAYSQLLKVPILNVDDKPASALQGQVVNSSSWGVSFANSLQYSHVYYGNEQHTKAEVVRVVYGHKQTKGELINALNKLFAPRQWTIVAEQELVVAGQALNFIKLRNVVGKERLLYYWYQVNGKTLLNASQTKLTQAWTAFTAPNSRAELVAFSISDIKAKEAEPIVQKFIDDLPKLKMINAGE